MTKFMQAPCGSPSNYVLGLYPAPEGEAYATAYQMAYSALCSPFNVSVQVCREPSEMMNLYSLPYISLELPSKNTKELREVVLPPKGVYVVGNSKCPVPCNMIEPREVIHVHVDVEPIPIQGNIEWTLYGFQVLPIALYEWRRQHANL